MPVARTPAVPSTVIRIEAASKPLSSAIGSSLANRRNRGSMVNTPSATGHVAKPSPMPSPSVMFMWNLPVSSRNTNALCASPMTM